MIALPIAVVLEFPVPDQPQSTSIMESLMWERLLKRMDEMSFQLGRLVTREELERTINSIVARIDSVVPRAEQEARWKALDERLAGFDKRMEALALLEQARATAEVERERERGNLEAARERWPTWLAPTIISSVIASVGILVSTYYAAIWSAAHVAGVLGHH